jgi:hypothetical protein
MLTMNPTNKCRNHFLSLFMVVFVCSKLYQTPPPFFLILASYSLTFVLTDVRNGKYYSLQPYDNTHYLLHREFPCQKTRPFIQRFECSPCLSMHLGNTEIIRSVTCHTNYKEIRLNLNFILTLLLTGVLLDAFEALNKKMFRMAKFYNALQTAYLLKKYFLGVTNLVLSGHVRLTLLSG